jgi:hypothetical protein
LTTTITTVTRNWTHTQPQPNLPILLNLGLGKQRIVQLVERLQSLLPGDLAALELFVRSFQLVGFREEVIFVLGFRFV